MDLPEYAKKSKNLRKWLREQRQEKGFTMRSLAAKLGVPHSYIGKIENGERRLDIPEYLRYCKVMDINPNEGLKK